MSAGDSAILWSIAIVVSSAFLGMGMFFQGKILLKPEDSIKMGKQLKGWGIALIVWAIIHLLVVSVVLVIKG